MADKRDSKFDELITALNDLKDKIKDLHICNGISQCTDRCQSKENLEWPTTTSTKRH